MITGSTLTGTHNEDPTAMIQTSGTVRTKRLCGMGESTSGKSRRLWQTTVS